LQNEIEIEPAQAVTTPRKRGQRTPRGQAIASRNATRHGIMSPHPVIIEGMESLSDWEHHRAGIVANLAPEGALEAELAERLANVLWRIRRVTRFETAVINFQVAETKSDLLIARRYLAPNKSEVPDPEPQLVALHQEKRVIPTDADKIMRYETHLHRQSFQLLHEIEAMQARRRGESTPLARLDISSPPLS
jgi:hypothetical protein